MPAVKLHQGLVAAFISVVDDASPPVKLALRGGTFKQIAELLGRRHEKSPFSNKPFELVDVEISPKTMRMVGLRKGRVLVNLGHHDGLKGLPGLIARTVGDRRSLVEHLGDFERIGIECGTAGPQLARIMHEGWRV